MRWCLLAVVLGGCTETPRMNSVDGATPPDLIVIYDFEMKRPPDFAGVDSSIRDLAMAGPDAAVEDLAMPDLAVPDDLAMMLDDGGGMPSEAGPMPDLAPAADLEINYCILQFPASTTTKFNVPTETIYGRVYQMGVTDVNKNGPGAGIGAQIGWGAAGTDPRAGGWTWFDASPNNGWDWSQNNDEYQATLDIAQPGTYSYAYRFTVTNGAGYTYCDTVGNGGNMNLPAFDPAKTGMLTVTN
jgi:hypothetical protein